MESSFQATKMALMASKKQDGNVKKRKIESTPTDTNEANDHSFNDATFTPHNIVSNRNIDCQDNSTSNSSDSNITDVETPIISTSDSQFTDVETPTILRSPLKKGVKRKINKSNCMRSINKKLRNSGKEYIMGSTGKKVRKERKIDPPCTEKCKLKCFKNFTEEERMVFFHSYWDLGDLQKQRIFIKSSMEIIQPAYRYVREGGTRKKRDNNNAFFLYRNGEKVRVCKLFYRNTLNITNRTIRTVQQKRNKMSNVLLENDLRGRHGKQAKIDEVLKQGVNAFIAKIPKIESHYTRASTSKHFIDGSKTIADIHRDYMADCKASNVPFVNYVMFYRIFTDDYNISFFTPNKDLCETCCTYDNAEGEEKNKLEEYYNQHIVEKELSFKEKKYDEEEVNATVVVYGLQPVMQIPKGDVSVFYYKSKLNVYNFTIYDLKSNECECFIWDESNGHRGINELGSCVLQFLKKRAGLGEEDFIFYSDNCTGQQRNKYMVALYIYAISYLQIKSITHKYLIKGHTQNEGDSVHSLIERQVKRQLKAGPMYTPELFINAVRAAKKTTKPFNVTEMCFEDFFDIKALATEMELQNMAQLNVCTVVALRFERNLSNTIFFKTSYNDKQFRAANNITTKKKQSKDITLTRAYYTKPKIADNKKTDLLELLQKNHIPKYYKHFYEQL